MLRNSGCFKKGCVPWNKGKKTGIVPITAFKKGEHFSRVTEFKKGREGKLCWNWRGNNVGYQALHSWIRRKLGNPKKCIKCGLGRNVQWANKNYKYERNLCDWISLCYKCHRLYDRKNGWGKATQKYPYLSYNYA